MRTAAEVFAATTPDWCSPCNRMRLHRDGVCIVAYLHLAPCACGRPTPGGQACSSCDATGALEREADALRERIRDEQDETAGDASW